MLRPRLPHFRQLANAMLTDTCVIRRVTNTPDDAGGLSESWADAATVACRIGQPSSREYAAAGRTAEESDAVIRLPAGTDVRGADRIVTGGVTYEVGGPVIAVTDELIRSVFVAVVS